MYMCMWGCLDKYIRVATWPTQTKIPDSTLGLGCHEFSNLHPPISNNHHKT